MRRLPIPVQIGAWFVVVGLGVVAAVAGAAVAVCKAIDAEI